MIAKLIASAALAAGLLSVSMTSAQDAVSCSGPWVEVDEEAAGIVWGPESRCECGPFSAGVLASNEQVGWFWTRGSGTAYVEVEILDPDDRPGDIIPLQTASQGRAWFARDGRGVEGVMHLPAGVKNWRWSGRYRVQCATGV